MTRVIISNPNWTRDTDINELIEWLSSLKHGRLGWSYWIDKNEDRYIDFKDPEDAIAFKLKYITA